MTFALHLQQGASNFQTSSEGDGTSGDTMFGFNVYTTSYDAYDPASETPSQQIGRLVNDYGTFADAKTFYGGMLPSTYNTSAGEGLSPSTWCTICFTWTLGSVVNGSHDATITSYAQSVPADRAVRLCMNEVDQSGRISDWPTYVADMDHLYDLLESLNLQGTVEVWDCFMSYSLSSASGPAWQDTWTNPAKRHGIVWDHYWNQSTIDKSGQTAIGEITGKMDDLGMTRWCIGELGDRRPGTDGSTETDDTSRAQHLLTHLDALLAASPQPEGICWFDLIGTTGDHRILTPPLGDDSATYAMYRTYVDASMGR